jgi:DUF3068 family protein
MRTKRRFPTIVLAISAGFVAAALLWWAFAVPALVKYPTDLDVTARYEGTFTLFVDATTTAPLATPLQVPLHIERHIRSLGNESSSSRVVVEATITQKAGDLVDATQTNAYVMDRRTLQNVADDRAYAFDPSNVVDRSGSYRLNLPFDTSSRPTYPIYKNEIAATYEMHRNTTTPASNAAGLHLRNFTGSATEVPLDDAYLAQLKKVVALPGSMTLDQLKPQLKAAGLDVDAALEAVAPVITADDLASLARIAAKPIPLQYVLSFEGTAGVEPTTGAEVDVGATEWVGAKPVLADVSALQALIAHYPDVPEVVAVGEALAALSSAPSTKLFEYRYQQTLASVVDIAGEVKSQRNQIRFAELYVPFGLLGAAALSLTVGAFVYLRRRGPMIRRTAPTAVKPTPTREPASRGNAR